MGEGLTGELGLPPIDQVSYVVEDLDRAIERFAPLFGPIVTHDVVLKNSTYRGQKSDVSLKIGFGRSGDIEIELIEVVSGQSPHTEFLAGSKEGMHHVRCLVDDLEPVVERAARHGYENIWSYEATEHGVRLVYVERDGTVLELVEGLQPAAG